MIFLGVKTVKPTSVEFGGAFSASGLIATKIRSLLEDERSFFQKKQ
jgi:hypothetical protein